MTDAEQSKGEAFRKVELLQGDITRLAVDAIVNAANESLLGGGGVDGAIYRAAGPELLDACRPLRGCAPGDTKVTPGFGLPAGLVLHTVGPGWRGGDSDEESILRSCYRVSLERAREHGARTIAFPAISTGAFGFPADRAVQIALTTIGEVLETHPEDFDRILLVFFAAADLDRARKTLAEILTAR